MIFLSNKYKHIPDEMLRSANKLTSLLEEYNDKLQEIQNLINDINTSSAWKNVKIKAAFNKTCNSYMKINNNRSLKFAFSIMKLKEKARCADEHEKAYATGGQN